MPAMPAATPARLHTGLPGLPATAAVPPIRYSAPVAPPPAPIPPSVPAELPAAPASGEVLRVPLSQVGTNWPDPVRAELAGMDVANAVLALPVTTIEQALKSGHVQFAWRQICAWIEPAVAPAAPANAEMTLDLPLKVIAPLFMARYRPTAPQRKANVDEQIPDLFGRASRPHSDTEFFRRHSAVNLPASHPAAPAMASAPAPAAPLRMAAAPAAPAPPSDLSMDLEAIMGPPSQRHGPKEIVSRTAKLPGVLGAMLVMSDGMLVTSAVPTTLKAELVAAFVPQMFGRMSQYARELNMGGLSCLSFTVEAGCWQIVKQSNIYFATLCRPKQLLPIESLAAIAAELNKQQM
jgi:predicted regulator of Ras-like GTPase activity (Roadblock/LC7/MglB family)